MAGSGYKTAKVAPLYPDILAVQEVESLDRVLLLEGSHQPTFRDSVADPRFPRRSIGVFSYTGLSLNAVDSSDRLYAFRRFEALSGTSPFQVAAVWTYATRSATTSYRQSHEGLTRFSNWIGGLPTIVLGDFNANASYRGRNWHDLMNLVNSLGLVSAYHHFFGESFGQESRPTYYHRCRDNSGAHLDYCFIPSAWAPHIRAVEVGRLEDWRTVSDHVPLIVELDLPIRTRWMSQMWVCFLPDKPSGWAATDFTAFTGRSRWIFARTMPENPHEYTLRKEADPADFDAAVRYIRECGHMEEFAGKPYKVLEINAHKYWTMGAEREATILINRKLLNGGQPERTA